METSLEKACKKVKGKNYQKLYDSISNIILLNYNMIKKNDKRLSAKATAILFDENIKDKSHLLSNLLNDSEMTSNFSKSDIKYTKKLLKIDPLLKDTLEIIKLVKKDILTKEMSDILQLVIKEDLEKYILEAQTANRFTY